MRVNELAKELGVVSKDLLAVVQDQGVDVSNTLSKLEDSTVKKIRDLYAKGPPKLSEKVPPPPPVEPPPRPEPPVKVHVEGIGALRAAEPTVEAKGEKKPSTRKPKATKKEDEKPKESKVVAPVAEVEAPKVEKKAPVVPPAPVSEKAPEVPKPAAPDPKPIEKKPVVPAVAPVAAPVIPPVAKVETPKPVAAKPSPPKPAKPQEPPKPVAPVGPPADKVIRFRGSIIIKDLAEHMGLRPNKLIAELMASNVFATINDHIDPNVARKIVEKHGFTLEHEKKTTAPPPIRKSLDTEEEQDRPEDLVPRPPVVTFMGHVDHGKTSLLDKIRNAQVAKGEWGGITQHIGAYTVETAGKKITFLDTPGHAAFTAMRARGANLTDIVVIVVAADDGIMPQTKEAIAHARAADVTILIAINKIDLPGANVMRVRQQLQGEGLAPEDWGGETVCVPVSAVTGEGIDHLLEMILLQAEVLELRANPKRRARGYVIESQLEPGMGPTVSLLITQGTLNMGDAVVCGPHCGKVRALINDHGVKVKSASPATPVKCLGLSGVPDAGAEFLVCMSEKIARDQAEGLAEKLRLEQITTPRKASLDDLFVRLDQGKKMQLKIILKTDTQGSVEAIVHALGDIKSDKVVLNVIHSNTGNVTENDVMLASASDAVILGFHVAREPGVESAAKHEGVDVRMHHIIYEMIDQVRDAMAGLLAPVIKEKVVGRALIKQTFSVGKGSKVAGCQVTSGLVRTKFKVRVKRADETLFEGGHLSSLKRFQDSVTEVKEGQECGIRLERFSDFQEGDMLEFYEFEEIKQTL